MRRSIKTILTALAVMVGAAGAQAHDYPLYPGHKHGLQIYGTGCRGGEVYLTFRESTKPCGGTSHEMCSYTCLYQVWSEWQATDGYRGRDTEPAGGGYYKCHIRRGRTQYTANFHVRQPQWGTGEWGVSVRDGWSRRDVTCY